MVPFYEQYFLPGQTAEIDIDIEYRMHTTTLMPLLVLPNIYNAQAIINISPTLICII